MMKKAYHAPELEIEVYQLDASIASNCTLVVSNGPAMGNHNQCADYIDPFGMNAAKYGAQTMAVYNVLFYEDTNCDCYTTGGDYGYWTS